MVVFTIVIVDVAIIIAVGGVVYVVVVMVT